MIASPTAKQTPLPERQRRSMFVGPTLACFVTCCSVAAPQENPETTLHKANQCTTFEARSHFRPPREPGLTLPGTLDPDYAAFDAAQTPADLPFPYDQKLQNRLSFQPVDRMRCPDAMIAHVWLDSLAVRLPPDKALKERALVPSQQYLFLASLAHGYRIVRGGRCSMLMRTLRDELPYQPDPLYAGRTGIEYLPVALRSAWMRMAQLDLDLDDWRAFFCTYKGCTLRTISKIGLETLEYSAKDMLHMLAATRGQGLTGSCPAFVEAFPQGAKQQLETFVEAINELGEKLPSEHLLPQNLMELVGVGDDLIGGSIFRYCRQTGGDMSVR